MGFLERKFLEGVRKYQRAKVKAWEKIENPFLEGVREYREIKRKIINFE